MEDRGRVSKKQKNKNTEKQPLKHIQQFTGFFGGYFLRAFLVVVTPGATHFAIHHCMYREDTDTVAFGIFSLYETYILACLLTPFDEPAFEVCFGLFQGLDIHMWLDDADNQEILGEYISLIQVDCSDQRLESVAEQRSLFIGLINHPGIILDKFVEPQLLGQLIEMRPAYNFRAHFRQKAFSFIGVFFEKQLGHDRSQYGIPQKLQPLIAVLGAVLHRYGHGFMAEGQLIEVQVARNKPQHILQRLYIPAIG